MGGGRDIDWKSDRADCGGKGRWGDKFQETVDDCVKARDLTVLTSGADEAQRAMEDARSILKAVGKGMSEILLRSTLTLPLSMPWVEIRGGI